MSSACWPRELGYEYLKDWQTDARVLGALYFYRLLMLRLQGEARLLDPPDEGPPVEPVERPDRFLVRKLGKVVRGFPAAADIAPR